MRFRLIPRDEGFFPLFDQSAAVVGEVAVLLESLLDGLPASLSVVDQIEALERRGDEVTAALMTRTNGAIITPFDREDIHGLAAQLDDVVDDMRHTADLVRLHRVDSPIPEVKELATVLGHAAEATVRLIAKLAQLRDINVEVSRVYALENEGDQVFRTAVAHLFSGEYDAFVVLKWKDIVEGLERSLNGLEQVAHLVESIAVKHS
jgi:uncharacterized protein